MELLARSDLEAIDALCRRGLTDAPSADELDGALFTQNQRVVVFGDPSFGVAAVAECDDGPHIRLLVVDPTARGKGHGHALLAAAAPAGRVPGAAQARHGLPAQPSFRARCQARRARVAGLEPRRRR